MTAARVYLDRTVDPPRLPAHNAVLERLRAARGDRFAKLLADAALDPNAVLAYETHIEPNPFNDNDPEWVYELTTPLCEAYRARDAEAVKSLLARGALASRFVTLPDGSTAPFQHTYVAYRLPRDAWTYRDMLHPVPTADARAPAARLLERAFERELEAASRGTLPASARDAALVGGLFLAIERQDPEAIDRWLAAGADRMLAGPGGVTAVGLAIDLRDHRTAKRLLEHPAALEAICTWNLPRLSSPFDLYPIRPLHAAAARGDEEMLRHLLDRGADPAQGFPRCYSLLVHFLAFRQSGPDPDCLDALAGPTVRRLRDTIGDAAMMAGLADYWSSDVLSYLERARLIPAAR
jgi:hypothetical protein